MTLVGYARVSSDDQDYTTQVAALTAAGCKKVFAEKFTGTTTKGRVELQKAITACKPGDVLVIVRLDRMARSLKDLLGIMEFLDEHEIGLKCLTQPIDTTSAAGRLFVAVIGAVAEFENELRKERQRVGIDAAKKRGVYKRERKFSVARMRHLRIVRKFTPQMVADELGCSAETVMKYAPVRSRRPSAHPPNQPPLGGTD